MKETIRKFLSTTLLIDFTGNVDDATDLFRAGLIDSYGYVELVVFLESEFGIKISDEELFSNALLSVTNMQEFLQKKQAERRLAA